MMDRLAWWTDARFGLMIHWGVYAALGGYWRGERVEGLGEWIRWHGKIPAEEYAKVAADFDPKDFDADAWARLAAAAGMRHLVFTAKHHDGFALFDSAVDRFNSVRHARFGRDAVAELAAACRRHGVKFGLYYSHAIDWNDSDAAQRPVLRQHGRERDSRDGAAMGKPSGLPPGQPVARRRTLPSASDRGRTATGGPCGRVRGSCRARSCRRGGPIG